MKFFRLLIALASITGLIKQNSKKKQDRPRKFMMFPKGVTPREWQPACRMAGQRTHSFHGMKWLALLILPASALAGGIKTG
ncbi:MAG: hypothetical protein H0X43_06085 [Nitrosospira sp.]|nr:hypothetical protein [Nitrosospira sp.]